MIDHLVVLMLLGGFLLVGLLVVLIVVRALIQRSPIDRGVVVYKSHHDPQMTVIPMASGAVPVTQPERWRLHLENNGVRGHADVPRYVFDRYHIGQWYP